MPRILISNLQNKSFLLEDKKIRLINALLEHTDIMHACGGKGRCTTCKVKIINGMNHISPPTTVEKRFKEGNRLGALERLSCQFFCENDIEIEIPKDVQLPHLTYD